MPVGYIYKLESSFEDPGLYIGSTKNMTVRKYAHKRSCVNPNSNRYNLKVYQYIRDYGGWSNWFMLTLEEFEYVDKKELVEREQYWIKELKADLNSKDAVMDKDYFKKRYQDNKEYYKNYREENKDYHKNYDKKYFEKNKKKILENSKKYHEENREKILKKNNEKFDCECGGKYTHGHKTRHINSKKHQSYLSSKVI